MAAPDFGRNLVDLFEKSAAAGEEKPFLWGKVDGRYRPWSWATVRQRIHQLSRALRAKGLKPGDRVLLVSENRPEWPITDLAVLRAGGVTVPAYTTNTTDDHLHLLTDSGAAFVVVSGDKLAKALLPAIRKAGSVKLLITLAPLDKAGDSEIETLTWDETLALGDASPEFATDPAETLSSQDLACLIYTSGTGGKPKGVMLSHGNIRANVEGAYHILKELGLGNDVFLSFLPLSHAYEHTAGLFLPIAIGAQIYYAEGLETLSTNLTEAKPTIMACVPRLYEVMRQRILNGIGRQKGLKPILFAKAVDIGSRSYEDPRSLSFVDRMFNPLLDLLVRKKVRERFGGRMKALVSGGAPLNYDVGLFFTALGLPVFQGYGQTECSPVISVNRPGKVKLRTVGPPLPGIEVRFGADGEILVRGEAVMQGYWQDADSTARTLIDGWLYTGDVGIEDNEGYIQITDRKRDLIVNSGGDNVSPQRVEGIAALEPEIGQVLVYGDQRPHLVALIVPDQDFVKAYAKVEGKHHDLAFLAEDNDFQEVIGAAMKRVNKRLSPIERIRRFKIMHQPFTIENGMMTPTLKLKRQIIYREYEDAIGELYKGRVS
ncbi:MAG: long-chain fatty acid--CoA ligase [Alphaproteobacteria bacterium]